VQALLVLALLALPACVLITLGALAIVLVHPRSAPASALAASGVLSAATWVVLSYRAAVRADETGGTGDVFDLTHWLVAAAACSTVALAAVHRRRRSVRTDHAA